MIVLKARQRIELEAVVARRSEAAGFVRRARVILLSADGVAGEEIARRLDLSPEAVSRIRARFRTGGVSGRPSDKRQDGRTTRSLRRR
jgi:transposase